MKRVDTLIVLNVPLVPVSVVKETGPDPVIVENVSVDPTDSEEMTCRLDVVIAVDAISVLVIRLDVSMSLPYTVLAFSVEPLRTEYTMEEIVPV